MSLHVVILAGGRGERFWPLSRRRRPKQLLPLFGERTLLESTVDRLAERVPPARRWVAAALDLKPELEALDLAVPTHQFLWETVGRNTAPALGAAAESVRAAGGGALLVLPSDHWIPDAAAFWSAIEVAESLLVDAPDRVVTLGIDAAYPETGYGYIERAESLGPSGRAYRVARFHEKPDRARAEEYARRGGFYWNAGIFVVDAAGAARALRRHAPEMTGPLDQLRAGLAAGQPDWSAYYERCPSISIDYAVAERAEEVAVVEARFEWSDLGAWPAWAEHRPPDARGNRRRGETIALESDDCLLYSEDGGLLAVLGVKDLIVVRVGDATLVCAKDRAQEIRRLVEEGKLDASMQRYF